MNLRIVMLVCARFANVHHNGPMRFFPSPCRCVSWLHSHSDPNHPPPPYGANKVGAYNASGVLGDLLWVYSPWN